MNSTHIIGIDLAKHVFHLVGHDCCGRETFRKKLTRQKTLQLLSVHEPVIIAMEACGGSHWFARKCQEYGHQVKLIVSLREDSLHRCAELAPDEAGAFLG